MKICPRCHLRYENQDDICPQDGVKLENLLEEKKQMFDSLIGTTLEGRYKIISKLGQGGMGAVYKAEQIRMNRICAIKVIPEDMAQNGDAIERFNREAKMSALINDQHAVMVYDFGETSNGMYFLAMEYVEGETLASLIKRERIIPLTRTFEIVRQAGQALTCAHSQNIVHRDLKPDNIMIAKKDANDWIKVLDFGIAKRSIDDKSNDLTQTGMVIGTPLYMSPEQLTGDKLDPRSDIYSFSIIAYQLLTGKLPFSGDNAQAIMVKRITENPIPPSVANPQIIIPPGVEAAIMNALVRNRDMRTPSIQKFVEQFEQGIRDFNNYHGKTSPTIAVSTSPQHQQPYPPMIGGIPPTQNTPSGRQSSPTNPQTFIPTPPPNLGMGMPPNPNPYPTGPRQTPLPNQPMSGMSGMSGMPTNPKQPFPNPTNPPGMPTNPTPYPNMQTPLQPMPGISGQQSSYPNTGPSMQSPGPSGQVPFPQMQQHPTPRPPYQQQTPIQQQLNPTNPYLQQQNQPPFPQVQQQIPPTVKKKSYKTFWIFAGFFIFIVLAGGCSMCALILGSDSKPSTVEPVPVETASSESTTKNPWDNTDNTDSANKTVTAEEHYNQGFDYLQAENYALAITEFKAALETNPNYLEAQEDLSIALYNSKQYNEAVDAFIKTQNLDSSNPETLAFMGFAYELSNQTNLANETYDKFLANYPDEELANRIQEIKKGTTTPPQKISY